ncbi:MAG: hypothetical protein JO328_13175 [Hyphomicrobiales bacterium]|nr:hypothetical protein [Hyphomicrobiales bacterium]MBV8826212.1 hypothetical protein [Hyphomicrobiales bacterium]MBV9427622.1 hypothetical protein [Bradyrhizobiaceae bacterium]
MIAPRPILSFLSYLLYAAAALIAVKEHPSAWADEHDYSLPAAISHAVYGTRLGIYQSSVRAVFFALDRTGLTPQSLRDAVEVASRGDLPPGGYTLANDGLGAGQPLFMGVAADLFGPHLSSFPILFLLLMGIATFCFIARFDDSRLFMVPLTFTALCVMLLTPLLSDQEVLDQAPIGGNRFFGMLGVLPALHLYFDLREEPTKMSSSRSRLSAVQLVLLLLTILTRSSSAYLLGLLALGGFERWRSTRVDRARRSIFWREVRRLALLALVSQTIMVAIVYDYMLRGRVFGAVWHRAFVSLSLHPEWPFGNLREVYDCTKVMPEGLTRAQHDANGYCVWFAVNHDQPASKLAEGVLGPAYEATLRNALFKVICSYPRQAFELYFYYKPLFLWQTLRRAVDIEWRAFSPSVLALVTLEIVLFLGFIINGALAGKPEVTWRLGVIPILFVLSIPSQFIAWSSLHTGVEVVFYMYCLIAAAVALAVQAMMRTIARPAEPG